MESGQHLKLPKSELGQMEADLRRQARMERLKIDIKVKDNGDNTVDVSWTVSESTMPAAATAPASASGEREGITVSTPAPGPATTAASSGSDRGLSAATSSTTVAPNPPSPTSHAATTASTPTAGGSGSTPVRSTAGPSVLGGVSEIAEAGSPRAPGTSGGTVSGGGKVPDQAVAIVTDFEAFVDHVYDDGVGVATIGYGTTRYPDGRPVRFGDPNITEKTAEIYLSRDLESTVHLLNASIPHWDEMNSNQRSALISFAYNLGDHFFGDPNFRTITSTLRDKRWHDVPKAMELYSNPNDPKVHAGLLRRRKAEGELWQGKGPFAKIAVA